MKNCHHGPWSLGTHGIEEVGYKARFDRDTTNRRSAPGREGQSGALTLTLEMYPSYALVTRQGLPITPTATARRGRKTGQRAKRDLICVSPEGVSRAVVRQRTKKP